MSESKKYDESSIKSYDTNEGIRNKLSVYLNERNQIGSYLALMEIAINSLDEYNRIGGGGLVITYDTKTKVFTNQDYFSGIPLGSMETIMEQLHSGAKLDNSQMNAAYDTSGGTNGCGLCIAKSVSDYFIVESHRDGKSKRLEYRDGYRTECIERNLHKGEFPNGTYIELRLAESVLGDTNVDPKWIYDACETMAYNSPKFDIKLTIDGKLTHFYSENGLVDLYHLLCKRKQLKPSFPKFISLNFDSNGYTGTRPLVADAEIYLNFNTTLTDSILSFVNKISTTQHGTHVTGLKAGITMAMNKYMEDNEKIPKKYAKIDVSGAVLNEFLIGIVSIRMKTTPFYNSQVKARLDSEEVTGWVKSKVYNLFFNWLTTNPKEADKLVNMLLKECEARHLAKSAKEKFLGTDKKESFVNSAISKRLEDCLSRNPEECELFIVEGESASVGSARDPQNQAYYLLRGKIFNSIASNKLEDDILLDFINMLGIGFGEKKNLNKLKYHKIILLADADEDGHHITALLLGFFYKYYPELINEGHIYIGNPPLYAIELNKKQDQKIFIKNIDHYNYILVQTMLNKFSAHADISGKEIPEDIFEAMLYGLIDYMNYLDNFSNQQNITPNLLETIVLYYKDIQKHNFKNIERQGYKVTLKESNETHKILEFDADIHHYNVNFNEKFYNTIYLPIISKIAKDIKIYNIHLKDRESKQIYKGSLYEYSQMMNKIFEGKISPKIKGLGEMKSEYLRTSVIDPETRNLTKVTMEDAEKATKIIETFLGKKYMDEKKAHFESSMEERKLRE